MSEGSTSLAKWFSERPQWLQIAATRLLQLPELTDQAVAELVALCRQEADGTLPKTTCSFPTSAFSQGTTGILRLSSISDVEGVNALAPKKPLEFGQGNITIVYGNNGSGKSGYVRLLKHVCGAREAGVLYQNVYSSSPNGQKACISFELDGTLKCHTWSGQGVCDDLTSVDIFDTSFGKVFVSNENNVSYEPPVLSHFSLLVSVCEKIASTLELEAKRHQSKKPDISEDKKSTPEGIWYNTISSKTTPQEIDNYCLFGDTEATDMQMLQQRISEQAPGEKAKQLRKQKSHIDNLVQDAQKYLEQLSDENCSRIIAVRKKSALKKAAADTAANKVFSDSEIEGVGSDVWKELWEAARNYSVSAAYTKTDYPNTSDGARCVLCHQTLTQEARDRLTSFESFVKGEMQNAAAAAAKEYEIISKTIEALPTAHALKPRIDATGISQDAFASQVTEFFAQLQTRKERLSEIDSEETIPAPLLSPKWIEEANVRSKNLGELAAKHDEDAKSDNREEIKKKLDSLRARKWLSEHRAAIEEDVIRLKLLDQIHEAKKLTDTTALSRKKGELAEALITDAFVKRFNSELKNLGASQIKVDLVKTRVAKGRVLHKLQLRGTTGQSGLADVLSEGESRIVSIAAFLADVTGQSSQAPFVFDDPISSLDLSYEETVVQRLVQLAANRQVIVFTHRISLLVLLQEYGKREGCEPNVICVRSESWGTGEPGDTPLFAKKPEKALNALLNEHLARARKVQDEEGQAAYAPLAKSICSEFRVLLERMIECELLADVVKRFRRAVNTQGKLDKLARITAEDCKLFDDLMTKYSRYEHSQPDESPVTPPTPDELKADMEALRDWRTAFSGRAS